MRKAQADLHTLQQGLSPDDIKKVKETKEKISTELTSLTGSLEKASKDLTDSQEAVARLDCDASNNDELKNNKENLEKNIATVGDILKKLEEVYGQQLEMAKSDADKASLDLAAVRERWREAKDDVTNAQAEVERCQSQRTKFLEKLPSKKRAATETSSVEDKRQKQH
jgi:archaellum component FlaC